MADLQEHRQTAETALRSLGITFSVYGEDGAEERIMPFDVIPRIIAGEEWAQLEAGLKQRITSA